jgi:hypothetical protein
MTTHFNLDHRILILRTEDRCRNWMSLDDERLCILCKRKFKGRQVEIRRFGNGKYELNCPTQGCDSGPHLWIYPATPLVSHALKPGVWHVRGRRQERRRLASGLRPHLRHI